MGLHGSRLTLVLATLLGVLVVAGAAAAVAVGRSQRLASRTTISSTTTGGSPATRAGSSPDGARANPPSGTITLPIPSPAASLPASSPAAVPTSPSAPPESSGAGSSPGPVPVGISARALAAADAQPVVDLLGRYFTAINQHDYDAWLATVTTEQAKRTRDDWNDSYDTTEDMGVYVSDISRKGATLLVQIRFVSHQAVDKAPKSLPVDCIQWDVTYAIVDEGTGLRVGNSAEPPSMVPCA